MNRKEVQKKMDAAYEGVFTELQNMKACLTILEKNGHSTDFDKEVEGELDKMIEAFTRHGVTDNME